MQRAELEHSVREIFQTVLGLSPGPDDDVLRSRLPRWDSLRHFDLMFSLEEQFDIRFDKEELARLDSLGRIVQRVEALLEARHSR